MSHDSGAGATARCWARLVASPKRSRIFRSGVNSSVGVSHRDHAVGYSRPWKRRSTARRDRTADDAPGLDRRWQPPRRRTDRVERRGRHAGRAVAHYRLSVTVDGEFMMRVKADGLIIASPQARRRTTFGRRPIVTRTWMPHHTPIAPHTLTTPCGGAGSSEILIDRSSATNRANLRTFDGQSFTNWRVEPGGKRPPC